MIDHAYVLCGGESSRFKYSVEQELYRRRHHSPCVDYRVDATAVKEVPTEFLMRIDGLNKLLVPLAGKTIIERHLELLAASGIKEFTLLAGQNSTLIAEIQDRLAAYGKINIKSDVGSDLSSIHAVVQERGDPELLVTSGDTLVALDCQEYHAAFQASNRSASIAILSYGFGDFSGTALVTRGFLDRTVATIGSSQVSESRSPWMRALASINGSSDCYTHAAVKYCANLNTLSSYARLLMNVVVDGNPTVSLVVPDLRQFCSERTAEKAVPIHLYA
jgi:molybdopterin-guanine dinucleotide biosynthesis protein A